MSFLGRIFGSSSQEEDQLPGSAVISGTSKTLRSLQEIIDRRKEEGKVPQILLVGPPTGSVIEVFNRRGGRVTVEGEEIPVPPLSLPAERFDVILAFDLFDFLEDDQATALTKDWARLLKPGGRVLLIARSSADRTTRRYRPQGQEGGSILLVPRQESTAIFHPRGNAQWCAIAAPLVMEEIVLRRDGLREICLKRPPASACPP